MKVLFQNRVDALSHPGGDTTQMLKTKERLQELGVQIDISLDVEPDLAGYDLVHVFNLSTAHSGVRQIRHAHNHGLPVALSTIYWDRRHKYLDLDMVRYNKISSIRYLSKFLGGLAPRILNTLRIWQDNPLHRLRQEMLLKADILFPNSYAEAENVAVLFKTPQARAKTIVVPNGIEPFPVSLPSESSINSLPRELPDEYVLEAGRIEPLKGQLKVIRALYDRPEIPLVFVGRPESESYFQACQTLANKRGNTFFISQVPHDEMGSYYQRAKVHVLPSILESTGLVTLEAALFGANCVVSVHGPVAEYFGCDVWYCDPGEVKSIHKAILRAWEAPRDEQLKQRVLREGFSWQKAAEVTLAGYQKILKGSC